MLDRRILLVALASLFYLSGFSVQLGCGSDDPVLEFRDASEGCTPTEGRLAQPIALGARLDIAVVADGEDVTVTDVTVDDESIVAVEDVDNPFAVRALDIGSTQVEVRTASGSRGVVDLSVAEVAEATITPDDLTIWNLNTELAVAHEGATAELAAAGYALLPDGTIRLGVTLRDADGRKLIGHDVANWEADPELVELEAPEAFADDVVISHRCQPGDVTITTIAGGSLTLTLHPEQDASALDLYLPETGVVGGPLTLPVGDVRTVVLLAYDDDSRLLLGNGLSGFNSAIVEPEPPSSDLTAEIIDPPWAEPRGDIELDDEMRAVLESSRVIYVEGIAVGETTLRLEAAGLSLDVEVAVTEE